MEFGAIVKNNGALVQKTVSFGAETRSMNTNIMIDNRGVLYIQDQLPVAENLVIRSGIRLIASASTGRFYAEPRLSATLKMNDYLRLNAAWGLYNQFIFREEIIDRFNNFNYLWVTGNFGVPHANHYIGGINYFKNDFTLNVDLFYKTIDHLSREVFENNGRPGRPDPGYVFYAGDERIAGTDIYIKKDFGENSVWASYSLGKAIERFALPGDALPSYTPAPNDQRHEFKVAALYNIGKFCLSGNLFMVRGWKQ